MSHFGKSDIVVLTKHWLWPYYLYELDDLTLTLLLLLFQKKTPSQPSHEDAVELLSLEEISVYNCDACWE